jgi:hypothetical protein
MEVVKPSHVALCILSSMLFYPDEDDPAFSKEAQQKLRDILVKEVRRVDEVSYPSLVTLLQHIQVIPGTAAGRLLDRTQSTSSHCLASGSSID